MRFEARELKDYAEPVNAEELVEGAAYFSVHYCDEGCAIPQVMTLVFIGFDIEEGDDGKAYFQDVDSYLEKLESSGTAEGSSRGFIVQCEKDKIGPIFEYDRALERLMYCSLVRAKMLERDPNHQFKPKPLD